MIRIEDSDMTFERVYDSPFTPDDEAIRKANCLIIPNIEFRKGVEYSYSEYAEDILTYMKENGLNIDIAATDEIFQPIEMHSLLIDLGVFLVMDVSLPILINLSSSYIYDKLKQWHNKDAEVRVEYIDQKEDGSSKSIKYSGPAKDFDSIIEAIKKLEK